MGFFCASIHAKHADPNLTGAAAAVCKDFGCSMFVSPQRDGWTSIYPASDAIVCEVANAIASQSKTRHVLAFHVHDSAVLYYWYFKDGILVADYISCPDYFNDIDEEIDEEAMSANGTPEAFYELLDPQSIEALREVVSDRLIGEISDTTELPYESEEDRLEVLAELLQIRGAPGSYEDILQGISHPDVLPRSAMLHLP